MRWKLNSNLSGNYRKMFILNPDPYLLPAYRISPFTTKNISENHLLFDDNSIDDYFGKRFSGKNYLYTLNGREAINLALGYYNLKKDDIVSILTTSGNKYISRCVTEEIEKYCNWSRQVEKKTKVIFVNHEFGFPFKSMEELKKLNLPIIEDCAHTFFSNVGNNSIGETGDFSIYSFPKMFSLQIGGLLVSNIPDGDIKKSRLDQIQLKYVKKVLSHQIKLKEAIIDKRIVNYNYAKKKFNELGFLERFQLEPGTIPGVFMFKTDSRNINLPKLKEYFYAHGVQCSVFYGEESFFLPIHQNLNKEDIDYFVTVFQCFLKHEQYD